MDSTSSKDTLVYDQLNRLLSINAGAKGSYYYDGEGKRLRKDYAGSKTIYLYDQWGDLMTEVDTPGNLMCEYLWVNGKLVVKIYQDAFYPEFSGRSGTESESPGPPPVFQEYIFYYHLDHLGTPLALTNEIRNICWSADYLPFGEIYNELIAPVSNEVRLPGQYHDRETDLYYNWHRYYKPTVGRYYQADPIGLRGGLNLYAYVNNNPLTGYDISGLTPLECVSCPGGYWSTVTEPTGLSGGFIFGFSYAVIVYTCKTNGRTCAGVVTCRFIGPLSAAGVSIIGGGEVFNAYTAAALGGKSKGYSISGGPISVQLTFGESIANSIDIAKSVGLGIAYITCDVKIVGCL